MEIQNLGSYLMREFVAENFGKSFSKASNLDMAKYVEEKNGFSYISWANAWKHFVEIYPDAIYEVKLNDKCTAEFGNSATGYMVYTTVTAMGKCIPMWLPVMDFKNKSLKEVTTTDINKAVMRCLVKNLGMFGLGWYVYAGEDLPYTYDDVCKWSDEMLRDELNNPKMIKFLETQKESLETLSREKLVEYATRKLGLTKK